MAVSSSLPCRYGPWAQAASDGALAVAIDAVAARHGVDPIVLVRHLRLPWTLAYFVHLCHNAEEKRFARLLAIYQSPYAARMSNI
jgi:hypothetical protein